MSHTRYELGFTRHRKVLSLSHEAFRLWISANDHARGQASNGELYAVDFDAIPRCPPAGRKRDALVEELVRAGLWEATGDHWQIHDYLDWQDSRERIQNKKRTARERMQRVRANSERTASEVRSTDHTHTLSPTQSESGSGEGSAEGNQPEFTDNEAETVCPMDIEKRAEQHGIAKKLAAQLNGDVESFRWGIREFASYWIVGAGQGQMRSFWLKRLREWLRKQFLEGKLKAPGAIEHDRLNGRGTHSTGPVAPSPFLAEAEAVVRQGGGRLF